MSSRQQDRQCLTDLSVEFSIAGVGFDISPLDPANDRTANRIRLDFEKKREITKGSFASLYYDSRLRSVKYGLLTTVYKHRYF